MIRSCEFLTASQPLVVRSTGLSICFRMSGFWNGCSRVVTGDQLEDETLGH